MNFLTEQKKEMIKTEIERLEKLKVNTIIRREEKSSIPKLIKRVYSLNNNSEDLVESDQEKIVNTYYDATDNWLKVQIKAWNQILNNKKDKNMLDQINEALDDWLQSAWSYLGQENLEEESRIAKEGYIVFKTLLERTPNKKTRRGGKKHKKKQ